MIVDEPLASDTDFLITNEVNGKTYGICCPHEGRSPKATILYFSMVDGFQVDFVDGKKKQSDKAAACDLSDFNGIATLTLYKTDPQKAGVYPTGLEQIKQQTVQIGSGE